MNINISNISKSHTAHMSSMNGMLETFVIVFLELPLSIKRIEHKKNSTLIERDSYQLVSLFSFKIVSIWFSVTVINIMYPPPPPPILHEHSWHRKGQGIYLVSISIKLKKRVPISFSNYDFIPHVIIIISESFQFFGEGPTREHPKPGEA